MAKTKTITKFRTRFQKIRSGRRAKAGFGGFKQFGKGFLGGNGASELTDELMTSAGITNPMIKIPVKLAAGAGGGYYTGGKIGLIAGLAATGLDIAISIFGSGKDFFTLNTRNVRL